MTEENPHQGSSEAEAEMRDVLEDAESGVPEMERRSDELEEEIESVEEDWDSKESDPRVPGAQEDLEDVEVERQDIGEDPAGGER